MAKLPKYICFRVINEDGSLNLERVYPYELEKKAHWKRCEDDTCYWFECSACGQEPLYTKYKQEILTDYCPYCGALMVEEDENDKESV